MKGNASFREAQLTNNFGLTDKAIIREADAIFTTLRQTEGMPEGNFDTGHLKRIHQHLLGDMYPWAGHFRSENLKIGSALNEYAVTADQVDSATEAVLAKLQSVKPGSMTVAEYATEMSAVYVQLYRASPFPDGNARAARGLIDAFSEKHDMQVKWSEIPAEAFHAAIQSALVGKTEGVKALFRSATDYVCLVDKFGMDPIQKKINDIRTKVGLREEHMPTMLSASSEHLVKFAGYAILMAKKDLQAYANNGKSSLRDWESTSIRSESRHHLQHNGSHEGVTMLNKIMQTMMGGGAEQQPGEKLRGPRQ